MKVVESSEKVVYKVEIPVEGVVAETKSAAKETADKFALLSPIPKEVESLSTETAKAFMALSGLGYTYDIEPVEGKYQLKVYKDSVKVFEAYAASKKGLIDEVKASMFKTEASYPNPMVKSFPKETQAVYDFISSQGYTYSLGYNEGKKELRVYKGAELKLVVTGSSFVNLSCNLIELLYAPENKSEGFTPYEEFKAVVEKEWPLYKAGNKAAGARLRKGVETFGKQKTPIKRELMVDYNKADWGKDFMPKTKEPQEDMVGEGGSAELE